MICLWAAVGAVMGGVGGVVARVGPNWAAVLVHYAVPYTVLLAVVGSTAPRPSAATLRAVACFVPFVAVYYGVVALRFGAIPVLYASAWLAVALTVCPAVAAAVRWAVSRGGFLPALVIAGVAAVAVADGAVGNIVRVALGRLAPSELPAVSLVTGPIGVLTAVATVLLLPGDRRTRGAATTLLVPLGIVTTTAGWVLHFGLGPYG